MLNKNNLIGYRN